jgi:hypothetical protein
MQVVNHVTCQFGDNPTEEQIVTSVQQSQIVWSQYEPDTAPVEHKRGNPEVAHAEMLGDR